MGLLSKKPAKLDLVISLVFMFALEMGEGWVVYGPRMGTGKNNQKILERTDFK